ncbi:hypothetical protein CI109_101095 [Kwoniella shandongensis]|uniref:Uncharacterized protein n=1 Tax=Kwoniella shandongensis TaxID=1734106 RepID=A0A5M6C4Q6_9TREE|nr:uncharacterized protein CI109_001563 [Kwoniella shandongensis]KAA5530157.1 hypothetical protein CI109_001563 [Kwoniella shandongensis]
MDRQLKSPLLIETIGKPTKLSSKDTFAHLQNFLHSLPPCPSRTQLERLTDALGVEIGSILPAEGERREAERVAARAAARAERRRVREIEEEERKREEMEGMVEGLEEDEEEDGELENGAVEAEGEEQMDDRGDVEYGDVVDEDEDEPDNEDAKMEQDDE